MSLSTVHVIGAGLIGTSVGLALRQSGVQVLLSDRDPARVALACDLGAGEPLSGEVGVGTEAGAGVGGLRRRADVVLVCVPPDHVVASLKEAISSDQGATFSDVSSVKVKPQEEAQFLGLDLTNYVGGHPVAGRERGGPAMARADLFLGRPWVLTPQPATAPTALARVRELVLTCGAVPVEMAAASHDAALALVSHAPQAVASLLAARLVDADDLATLLAGQGLRDLTRIADSDPGLWAQIAAGNAGPLAAVLRALAADLGELAGSLETGAGPAAAAFGAIVSAGNRGRARLGGKHGERATRYVAVPVVISDEPGALARLLVDTGEAGINVEDLSLEHSPGAPVGLVELFVAPAAAGPLASVLAQRGWAVHHTESARAAGDAAAADPTVGDRSERPGACLPE